MAEHILGYPAKIEVSGNNIKFLKERHNKPTFDRLVQVGDWLGNITTGTPDSKQITAVPGTDGNGDFVVTVAAIGAWITGDRISPMKTSTVTWYTTDALLEPNLSSGDDVYLWHPSEGANAENEPKIWYDFNLTDSVSGRTIHGMRGMYHSPELVSPVNRAIKQFGEASEDITALADVEWENITLRGAATFGGIKLIIHGSTLVANDNQIVWLRCRFTNTGRGIQRSGGSGKIHHFKACQFDSSAQSFERATAAPANTCDACSFINVKDVCVSQLIIMTNCLFSHCSVIGATVADYCTTENCGALPAGTGNTEGIDRATLKIARDFSNDLPVPVYFPLSGSALIAAGTSLPGVELDFYGTAYDDSIGAFVEHSFVADAASAPGNPTLDSAVAGDGQVTLTFTADDSADVIYARYRPLGSGHSGAWVAESETFKRTGSGTIVVTGLSNFTQYEFSGYAKSGSLTSDWTEPLLAMPSDGTNALSPEEALRKILTDDADVSALISARLYPGDAPQSAPRPYGVYSRSSADHIGHMTGYSGCANTEINIEWYAESYPAVQTLADEARKAAAGFSGTVTNGSNSLVVSMVRIGDDSDGIEFPRDGSSGADHSVTQSYALWHSEITA